MDNHVLQLKNIKKKYGDLEVLEDINLEVNQGEFVTLLGPSGSGKSTIFRIITDLTKPDQGLMRINHKTPEQIHRIAYMPQKDTLLPWKQLIDNIALPLIIKGEDKQEARQTVRSMMKTFGLEGFETYYPSQLSGGMKQRATLMRTFLTDSDLMLLDEPFASLDAITRTNLQEWLLGVWQQFERSVLFITHSIEEAIYLSDKIYVLSSQPGQIVLSLPITIERPRDLSVMTSSEFNQYRDVLYKTLREQQI